MNLALDLYTNLLLNVKIYFLSSCKWNKTKSNDLRMSSWKYIHDIWLHMIPMSFFVQTHWSLVGKKYLLHKVYFIVLHTTVWSTNVYKKSQCCVCYDEIAMADVKWYTKHCCHDKNINWHISAWWHKPTFFFKQNLLY